MHHDVLICIAVIIFWAGWMYTCILKALIIKKLLIVFVPLPL